MEEETEKKERFGGGIRNYSRIYETMTAKEVGIIRYFKFIGLEKTDRDRERKSRAELGFLSSFGARTRPVESQIVTVWEVVED